MKKFFISLIILAVFGCVVLFIGWGQFSIPAGSYGVMVSKTGGINSKTIVPGEFSWYWERLLPTNVSLRIFSIIPITTTNTISGKLPSADIYSPMLEGSPDFSYKFSVETVLSIKSDYLPTLVKNTNAKTNADLELYIKQQSELIADCIIQYLLNESFNNQETLVMLSTNSNKLIEIINNTHEYRNLNIENITIKTAQLPDFVLYNVAKSAYLEFQNKVKKAVSKLTESQSAITAEDYLQIERFARWGKILQDYPILIDFLAVSRQDANSAIGALDILKNRKN